MLKPKLHVEDEIAKITKHSRLESPLACLACLIVVRQGGNRPDCSPVIFCDKCIMSQESNYNSVHLGTSINRSIHTCQFSLFTTWRLEGWRLAGVKHLCSI